MHRIMGHYVKVTMSDAKDDAQLATGPLLLLASTGINWHQLASTIYVDSERRDREFSIHSHDLYLQSILM